MFPIETISAKMLDYYVGRSDALIIDLRDAGSYNKSHVKGAVNVPYGELEGEYDFPKEKLFFTATEVVRVWQQRENLCAEDIEHGRS